MKPLQETGESMYLPVLGAILHRTSGFRVTQGA